MLILRCKVLVVGAPYVGKSTLTQKFVSDGVYNSKSYSMTVGADFSVKTVNIPDTSAVVELYLFDISGQDIYTELSKKYMEGASMVMAVYDVSSRDSFRLLAEWVDAAMAFLPKPSPGGSSDSSPNKTDLASMGRGVVEAQEGQAFAKHHSLEFFQCSAKEGVDHDAPFHWLANRFYKLYEDTTRSFAH
eukprot:m51a1_g14496 hypothetical protein (189) ;mRNA; f:768683-769938